MFPRNLRTRDGRPLLIREAVPADAGALLVYIEKVSAETDFLSFGPGEFELGEEEEAAFLKRCSAAENCIYLLAIVDGVLAGAINCSSRNRTRLKHVGEFGITVAAEFWGAGIGTALLDMMIDWARASNVIKKLTLRVRSDNHRAIQLYVQKGFTVEGLLKKDNFLHGHYHDALQMGRWLD